EKEYPLLTALAERCRQRILEIELKRGDTATAASEAALALECIRGSDYLLRLLHALGKDSFHRGYSYRENVGKACVLSTLIQSCYPTEADTPEAVASQLRAANVPEERLIALAFKAPQWVRHVEQALGWPGFAEGVWWFLAHTRDADHDEDEDAWKSLV